MGTVLPQYRYVPMASSNSGWQIYIGRLPIDPSSVMNAEGPNNTATSGTGEGRVGTQVARISLEDLRATKEALAAILGIERSMAATLGGDMHRDAGKRTKVLRGFQGIPHPFAAAPSLSACIYPENAYF
jgi:hypothetical protein